MTDTAPKPNRRRWRWLVVGLAIYGVMSWLQAPPPIDPRVVGEWVNEGGPSPYRRFFANGTESHTVRWAGTLAYANGGWSVAENTIIFTVDTPVELFGLHSQLRKVDWIWRRLPWVTRSASRYRIVELTNERLSLQEIDKPGAPEETFARKVDFGLKAQSSK